MDSTKPIDSSLVLSYLGLRKAIGIIGIALPFVLVVGKVLLESPGIQPSISDYYYTVMRDVFVGSLCAIGVFLMSYRGYTRHDDVVGNLACVFAIGVALFPTTPDKNPTTIELMVGSAHYCFAAAFFLTLAYFCLVLFRKTDPSKPMTNRKRQRNGVYVTCGTIILVCIVLLAIYAIFLRGSSIDHLDPIFWLEATAIMSFGISWLTKGEGILKDKDQT